MFSMFIILPVYVGRNGGMKLKSAVINAKSHTHHYK